jgi:hypothetical protein
MSDPAKDIKEDKNKTPAKPDEIVVKGGEPADPACSCPFAKPAPVPSDPKATEKAEKGMQFVFILAIVTIILVIVGILGMRYILPKEKPETVTYNQFTFTKTAGSWYTQWQYNNELYTIPLRFNPYEVENISISEMLNNSFNQQKITYVTFDPTDSNMAYVALAASELSINLAQVMGYNLSASCTTNETGAESCQNRTIAKCGDADKAVIYLKEDNETKVNITDSCITIQGKALELTRAVDRVLYKIYGIMP